MSELEKQELNRQVLIRLIKAIIDQEELKVISQIISMDPHLLARVLKYVNSPYFGLRREITSVEHAVAYLGYKKLKEFAFILLTTSVLQNKPREEVKKVLQFAYLMKFLARKLYPKYEDEAFMVGLFEPIREELGDELKEILIKAGVSDIVIEGLYNQRSALGKLKSIVAKLLPLCKKFIEGEIEEIPVKTPENLKSAVVKSCIDSENVTNQILELL
ncbi:HDOD domain-containing protein [Phorcysia thermohydrogeniphila]|uniref:EAL and modified HD-GYP domain-containing signal transduction protein n=1 Tax=Phorcysia thermohydrogeniphila TaxID=936138 RepID=A0A4R1G4K0_9BACT|nr:HDOD domain-containing protein [Phorcysia thermohydrogeniphila]TCK02887.1 EAL and modified HD-GYP domain-containing signal transduction protein [Phorcysia thermohydrogeniphila]